MNRQGENFEEFVKNSFCPVPNELDEQQKLKVRNLHFSYLGSSTKPPDFMLRGGDAVEVKKMEGVGRLMLNSSHPKQTLSSTSPLISQACRDSETWRQKDLLYVVGKVPSNRRVERIWMVYGDVYAANDETYTSLKQKLREGIENLDLEGQVTKELGKFGAVDPLGITGLRVRGMWEIDHPDTLYGALASPVERGQASLFAIMRKSKFESFPQESRERLAEMKTLGVKMAEVIVSDPDNPAKIITAITIEWISN